MKATNHPEKIGERTYTDGLKYLGMKFDDNRSEPFAGASGVIHPLLGESVTQFQAQAYKELLPAGGPVKTQVVGAYDGLVEEQAQRVKEFMNYQILHVMEEYDEELRPNVVLPSFSRFCV